MFSPSFDTNQKKLREWFNSGSLKLLWKTKVREGLRRTFFHDPFEYLDYHVNIDTICRQIETDICTGSYTPETHSRIKSEKAKGLCRVLVLQQARDAIILQRLSDIFYDQIKEKEPSNNSYFLPHDNKFSEKTEIFENPQYGSFRAWLDFQKNLFAFSKERNFVVITDIANYFDFISYTHLRNIVSGITNVDELALDLLIYSLSALLWQPDYMPRVEIGLPQLNTDAPRILAHSFLFELDQFLETKFPGDFVRYMDDIDLGVDTISQAKEALRDIDLILQKRQVRLNSGKTLILSKTDAVKYFWIKENHIINLVQRTINRKNAKGLDYLREKTHLDLAFRKHWRSFRIGNGDKILKRLLSISIKINYVIPQYILLNIIKEKPKLREASFRYLTHQPVQLGLLKKIKLTITEGLFIDDLSIVTFAKNFLQSPCRNDTRIRQEVISLIDHLKEKSTFDLYASFLLASKFATQDELLQLIQNNIFDWQKDPLLSRLVGSMRPHVSDHSDIFDAVIYNSGSDVAIHSMEFCRSIEENIKAENAVRKFLKAPNPSLPLGISTQKITLLLCSLKNENVPDTIKKRYLKIHRGILEDAYYTSKIANLMY